MSEDLEDITGIDMPLIEFFVWNRMAVQDFRCYRVAIARFDEHPHLVGREALIETHHASVFFASEAKKS
jgi:hypothetical protein